MSNIEVLWAELIETKCQYCKSFRRELVPHFDHCAKWFMRGQLYQGDLRPLECHKYEWEDRLTEYDFEERPG